MTDLTTTRLPILKAQRISELALGENLQYPYYNGNSILNIPSSLCHWLDVPSIGATSLDEEILTAVGGKPRRILLILMDGLALHRLQCWMENSSAAVWKALIPRGVFAPLTSVVPSTTTTALPSLWTGVGAKAHGIAGYELWLKEYGIVTNMISHSPMSYVNNTGGADGSIARAGFKPREFFNQYTLGTHLKYYGVPTVAFQHHSISHSGLSQMFLNDVEIRSFSTAADLWVNVRHWMESAQSQRSYTYVYWSEVDHLGHYYSPEDERPAAEFALFSRAFEEVFLKQLSAAARHDTLLILTADHGQISTPPSPRNELQTHPELERCLHIRPTGENRMVYLHVRPDKINAVREYILQTWEGQFQVWDASLILNSTLLGTEQEHPNLAERLGDLVLIPQGNTYLWWQPNKPNLQRGRHGGLHAEEMLVPFLAARLG